MELRYSLTVDDLVALQEHVMATSPEVRRQQRLLRTFAAVACLPVAAVLLGVVMSDWVAAAVVGVVSAAALWELFPALERRRVRRLLRSAVADGAAGSLGQVRLTVDDAGLTEEVGGTATTVPWDGIDRVEESTSHLFVFTAPTEAFVVPTGTPGAAGLASTLRSRTAPAPR